MDNLSWDNSNNSSALRTEIPMAASCWSHIRLDGFRTYVTLSGELELSEALFRSNLELQEVSDLDLLNQIMDANLMQNQEAIKPAIAGAGDSFLDASLWPEDFQALASEGTGNDDDGVSANNNVPNLTSSGNISLEESENYCSIHDEALSQCTSVPEFNKRKLNQRSLQISFEDSSRAKRSKGSPTAPVAAAAASSIDFRRDNRYEPDTEAIAQVKEMIYRAAAMRPVNLGSEEPVERPRRKNARISCDPQTVAARHRRERISERLRMLQRLVPGGTKMDTASMLDEAANYLKFLKSQVSALEAQGNAGAAATFPATLVHASNFTMQAIVNLPKPYFNHVIIDE